MNKYLVLLVMLCSFFSARAQLCTGSLGDPVVSITYGSGNANPGPPITGLNTNYSYTSTACPPDGSYTIVNRSSGCFSSTWHDVPQDHTANDVNGYMMLVNASIAPGVFYLDTVKSLCAGTTYEFSSWIVNMLRPNACNGSGIKPNLSFSIETTTGVVIQSYNSGDIPATPSGIWNQYGFFFTLPANISSVVVRMRNNAPGGCGNDLMLDDITFRPCGPTLNAHISGGTSTVQDYCDDAQQPTLFEATVSAGYNSPAYQWQQSVNNGVVWTDIPGATTTSYLRQPGLAANYQYRLTVAESGNIGIAACRIASNVIAININPLPVTAAANTGPVCEGAEATLSANDGATYNWSDANGNTYTAGAQLKFVATLAAAGKYYVLVTTAKNCSKLDSTTLVVNPRPVANAGPDKLICEGAATILEGNGGQTYAWSPSTGLSNRIAQQPTATPGDTTIYILTVTASNGCTANDTVTVNVMEKPTPDAGPDKKIIEGSSVTLDGSIKGTDFTWLWNPLTALTNGNTLTPVVAPTSDISYTLSAIAGNGCGEKTDQVFVRVFKKIIIPNAFSPNGDGINDSWNIEALDTYPESVTEVYNRFGQVVFRSRGYTANWNGTYNGSPLPVGTYYYTINRNKELPLLSGWVFIVR